VLPNGDDGPTGPHWALRRARETLAATWKTSGLCNRNSVAISRARETGSNVEAVSH